MGMMQIHIDACCSNATLELGTRLGLPLRPDCDAENPVD